MPQIPDLTDKTTAAANDRLVIRDTSSNTDKDTSVGGLAPAILDSHPRAFIKGRQQIGTTNTDQNGQLFQWGRIDTPNFPSAGDLAVTVTFPTPYAAPPFVTLAAENNPAALEGVWATITNRTATTVTFRAHVSIHGSVAPVTINWMAIGSPA